MHILEGEEGINCFIALVVTWLLAKDLYDPKTFLKTEHQELNLVQGLGKGCSIDREEQR